MNVKVLNCPDKYFKPYVERAVLFYAKELIPNTRIRNNCTTIIRFDGKIKNYGSCGAEGYNTKKVVAKKSKRLYNTHKSIFTEENRVSHIT